MYVRTYEHTKITVLQQEGVDLTRAPLIHSGSTTKNHAKLTPVRRMRSVSTRVPSK